MDNISRHYLTLAWFFILLFCIFYSTFLLQSQFYLHWDISFLMDAADRCLQGGSYTQHFFETNPPMAIYLYFLPVLGMKFFAVSKPIALKCFVFLMVMFSLILIYKVLKKTNRTDKRLIAYHLLFIAAGLLLLPGFNFGQREHFLVLLTLPYIYLTSTRMNNIKTNAFQCSLIGFLAGIGFVIKPFFILAFMCTEIYLAFYQATLRSWLRLEVLVIGLVSILYLVSVWILFPDYISTIIPLLIDFYYQGFGQPWLSLASQPAFLYSLWVALLYVCTRNRSSDSLQSVLFIVVISFLCIYLFEGTPWMYHLFPANFFAVLLNALLILSAVNTFKKDNSQNKWFLKLTVLSVSFLGICLYFISQNIKTLYITKHDARNEILATLQKYPPQTTYYLISANATVLSIVEYLHFVYVSRFPNYWWLPGLVRTEHSMTPLQFAEHKKFFTSLICKDLEEHQPRLLLLDKSKRTEQIELANFDYIKWLSSNEAFKEIWKQYQLKFIIEPFEIYEHI